MLVQFSNSMSFESESIYLLFILNHTYVLKYFPKVRDGDIIPVILVFGNWRQKEQKFKVFHGYMIKGSLGDLRFCLKKNQANE